MERSVQLRLVVVAPVLGAIYYYLLIFLIGWTSASVSPSWWFDIFPNRHMAAVIWMVGGHTVGVCCAAIPIAVAASLIVREQAILLGTFAGIIACTLGILPSLRSDIWPLVWNNHPIYFITDQMKLLIAVPLAAWIIRKPFSQSGLPTIASR